MMGTNIVSLISNLPAGTWQRLYAEHSLANNMQPVAMRDIPDQWYTRFARNQRKTCTYNGILSLPLFEFVRVAYATLPNTGMEYRPTQKNFFPTHSPAKEPAA